MPFLSPFTPPQASHLKDSIIKFPIIKLTKRNRMLSDNIVRNKTEADYE